MVALLYKILEISCENPICQGRENIPSAKRAALQVDQLSYIKRSVTVTVSSGSPVPTFVSWNVPSCPPSSVAKVK